MSGNGKQKPYQLSFKELNLPAPKYLSHRQKELVKRRERVANRKRVAKLLA